MVKKFGGEEKRQYLCIAFGKTHQLKLIAIHVFVAQLVEQLTLNQWVQGSSPCEDT